MIKMILAVDRGGSIGWTDGRLPWKLSADMKRFKELTSGHTVVMGRSTFVSLGRPNGLPNRKNLMLSRRPFSEIRGIAGDNVDVISSLDYVKQLDERSSEDDDIWIIGGAQVYEEALAKDLADRIHLTLVDTVSDGDVRLTTDLTSWKLFILREAKVGRIWTSSEPEHALDNGLHTTYIKLIRHR